MKKFLAILLAVVMILPCFAVSTVAANGDQPTSWTIGAAQGDGTNVDCTYDNDTKIWFCPVAWRISQIAPNEIEGGWIGIESITFDFGDGADLTNLYVIYEGGEGVQLAGWSTLVGEHTFAVDPTKKIIAIQNQERVAEQGFYCDITFNYPASTEPEPTPDPEPTPPEAPQPTWSASNSCTYEDGVLTSPVPYRTTQITPDESVTGVESITFDFGDEGFYVGDTFTINYSDGTNVALPTGTKRNEYTVEVDPEKTITGMTVKMPDTNAHTFGITVNYAEGSEEPEQPEEDLQPTWSASNSCTYEDGVLTSPVPYRTTQITPDESVTGVESITFDFGDEGFYVGDVFTINYSDGTNVALPTGTKRNEYTVDVDPEKTITGISVKMPDTNAHTFGITLKFSATVPTPPTPPTTTAVLGGKTAAGFVYVNEQYHALVLRIPVPTTPIGLRKLLVLPHTYGETGVCTICGAVEVVEVPADEVAE